VRPLVLAGLLAVLVPAAELAVQADARADFDPTGRGRKPKPKPTPGPAKPKPTPTPGTPPAKPPTGPQPSREPPAAKPATPPKPGDDGDARGGANLEARIARYTALLLQQPAEPFLLQKLADLHRERDGNLKKLCADFEQRAAASGADAWPARVALAGLYRQDGRPDDAIRAYEAAIAERASEPGPMLALAQLRADRGDKAGARAGYERALPLLKVPADVERVRRALVSLDIDLKDFDAAKREHEALVKASPSNLFVKAEYGRELVAKGEYERAEEELRDVVKASGGDNRALAPALRDLGACLAKEHKTAEALTVLKRALAVAGGAAGVRAEILLIMTDAFRAEGRLPELVALLEAEHGGDFQRLATMGALYEEIGEVDKAIAIYRKALASEGKHVDVRLRLVHLLQTAGELDAAVKEYEALVKAAPGNPDYVFELCETLIQRGDRPKALKLVQELEARAHDDETLAAVADFYERVEEKDKALKVLQRLAASGGGDPAHLVDLGDRYYQAGDKKKALETWAKIRVLVPNRARAASALGEVYLDHDMPSEALAALREAVQLEPANVRYKKALAQALERTATSIQAPQVRYAEARAIWEELLAGAGNDKLLAREARSHIVSLWGLGHELAARVAPLTTRFSATPPDLEAGRLLAEVQRKLHRLADAEATLRRVVGLAPGDEESLLALERVLVQEQNLAGAIDVLAKLVEVDPKRAREFYQRMAQDAAELYRDDDAIKYAARAVELSPEDASGHEKLGDMYRRRQDVPHAIAEYRQAIAKNDRLFPVYFDLAELYVSTGQVDEADKLFRRVVRSSSDEELVARAARMSMQLNLGRGALETLERDLLPVAVGNPTKTVYRRLLVELYGAMTFPLVQKVRAGADRTPGSKEAQGAAAARAELAKIGARAVKPLLDALADDKEAQQKVAIEVLAYVENKSAGPALWNFATGSADKALRSRAMIACGALRDPGLLPRYEQLLAPKDGTAAIAPGDAVAVAAAWGVARMGDKKAEALLGKLVASPSPDVRALAAIGLGMTRDKRHLPTIVGLARSPEAGATARAAAVMALGELGGAAEAPLVVALADAADPLLREAALVTMARLAGAAEGSRGAIARPVADAIAASAFSPDEALRGAAARAAVRAIGRGPTRAGLSLPVPDGPLAVREIVRRLEPEAGSPADRAAALLALGPSLERAAVAAVSTSPERGRVVADALLSRGAALGLAPFTSADAPLEAKLATDVAGVIEGVAAATVPGFVALARHPDLEVRQRAIELCARRPEPEAQAALIDALGDPDESVRRAALGALGPVKHAPTIQAVAGLLAEPTPWPLRVRGAEALGRLGASGAPGVADALAAAARGDAFALVREAALRALVVVDHAAAEPVLRDRAAKDPEPRVRAAASALANAR
jgi:tetratricopeptide (TPR) repeat protein/HEAT repeat protein